MAYKHIEDRRAYGRAYMMDLRHWRKAHRLCADCGQQDAFTLNGRYRCSACAEKKAGHPVDYVGVEKPWTAPNWRKEAEGSGRCYICGEPVMAGEGKWSGRPLRVCETHYAHMCRLAERGRAAFKAKHGETWGQWQYRRQHCLPPSASAKR
jgi:hypothetical protein